MKLQMNSRTFWTMMIRLLTLSVLLVPGSAYSVENVSNALQFIIPVVPGAEKHLDLLAYPSYLAVALDNNGIMPIDSRGVTIVDGHTLRYMNAFLHFSEKRGPKFIYQAKLEWEIASVKGGINLRVEVDTSEIRKGTVSVRIYTPLARWLPEPLANQVRLGIQNLSGEKAQKKMLAYFDDLEKRRPQGSGTAGILELILIQGYNTRSPVRVGEGREPGDAEHFPDQILFLATLGIWIIVVPLAGLSFFLWRRFKYRRLEAPHTNG